MLLRKKTPVTLCLDIGMSAFGIAVWDARNQCFIHTECYRTSATPKKVREVYLCVDNARRYRELTRKLERLIEEYEVLMVAAEFPSGGAKSQKAAVAMSAVSALVVTFFCTHRILLEIIIPSEIKRLVSSSRSVSKEMVIKHVVKKYGKVFWRKKEDAEHIADAIMCLSVLNRRLLKKPI